MPLPGADPLGPAVSSKEAPREEGDTVTSATTGADPVRDTTLRERKKALTRQVILDAASRLFEERGYDNVTVAEIAEAATVSVKTLFVYFRSKEDLVFSDTRLSDAVVEAVRAAEVSPATAVAEVLASAVRDQDTIDGIAGYHRAYGDSAAIQNRLLRLWAELEDRLADAIAGWHEGSPTPADRYDAVKLAGMVRLLVSPEVRNSDTSAPALLRVIEQARTSSGL